MLHYVQNNHSEALITMLRYNYDFFLGTNMIDKFVNYIQHQDLITPVLDSEILRYIDEVKTNFLERDNLQHFGINPFSKILFSGQRGCGKNLVAGYLAKEMKLKFFQTKPEAFLGNAKQIFDNLRMILEAASKTSNYLLYFEDYSDSLNLYNNPKDWLVVLLQEYKLHDGILIVEDSNVNYYNKFKDKVKYTNSIFDYHIVIQGPDRKTTEEIMKQRLLSFNTSNLDWETIYSRVFTKRLSYLQLVKISNEVATSSYLRNNHDINTNELLDIMNNYRNLEWDDIRREKLDTKMKSDISPLNI